LALAAVAGSVSPGSALAAPVYYHLVQYPQAGFGGFYAQVNGARTAIDMEMYELGDAVAEQDLVAAARRGVRVRVLLDRDYSGGYVNAAAYAYLRRHGVPVRWAPPHYIFHIKATTFDHRTSDIATANLTSRYYGTTRDAEVIDSDPAQVRAIEATFANDWAAAPGGSPRHQTVQAAGLVWSPNTASGSAEGAMVAQIDAARHTVDFESEELSDTSVYEALAADAGRGVSCRVVMMDSSEWYQAFAALARAGCKVRVLPNSAGGLYIHEKLVLDDPGTGEESLLIGSQNASWESLHVNRELGLLIHRADGGAAVIGGVDTTFQRDFSAARPWS
jgi:phosphatidylserine/phosphatidylglycerophosphate/cardiolipin synthase-like enzyme